MPDRATPLNVANTSELKHVYPRGATLYACTMIKTAVLTTLRNHAAELRALGIESLSLFGSVARDEDDENSDIDIAVKFDPSRAPRGLAYFGFLDRLEGRLKEALGRNVDVVPEPAVKSEIQKEIDRDRIVAF
jgi:predicted nucleotidyltransferase